MSKANKNQYKINKTKIFIKATILALTIVFTTLAIFTIWF